MAVLQLYAADGGKGILADSPRNVVARVELKKLMGSNDPRQPVDMAAVMIGQCQFADSGLRKAWPSIKQAWLYAETDPGTVSLV